MWNSVFVPVSLRIDPPLRIRIRFHCHDPRTSNATILENTIFDFVYNNEVTSATQKKKKKQLIFYVP